MFRRNIADGEIAYFHCYNPRGEPMTELVRAGRADDVFAGVATMASGASWRGLGRHRRARDSGSEARR